MESSVKAVPQQPQEVVLPVTQPTASSSSSSSATVETQPKYDSQGNTIQKEQQFIKEKSKRFSQFLKHVKSGETKPSVPSNNKVESVLNGGVEGIEKFQQSERGSQLTEQNQKVLGDIKEILNRENSMLQTRNDQEQVQTFVHNSVSVAKSIGNNPVVKEVIQKWRTELNEVIQNRDWKGLSKLSNDIIATMRQTEALLELTVELSKLVRILNNKVGVERSLTVEARDNVLSELRATLKVLSTNPLWKQVISTRDPVPAQKKEDIKVLQNAVDKTQLDQLSQSGQAVLQAIVGDAVSVQPFVDATREATQRILNDRQFIDLVNETQVLLTQIAENPSIADDALTQANMKLILEKLEFALNTLLQDPCIIRARAEGDKLMEVIKADPLNRALLNDLQKLRADASPVEIVNALRTILIPMILQHLNNIPLSNVDTLLNVLGTTFHVEISNLRLAARDLLPKDIHVKLEYEFDGNAQDMSISQQKIVAKIDVKNIQVNVPDAEWKYTRGSNKNATDSGRASFHTTGKGISVSMELVIIPGGNPALEVKSASCKMDKFSLAFTGSQHDKMYSFLTAVNSRAIRKNVQKAVQDKIKELGPVVETKLAQLSGQAKTKTGELKTKMQQRKSTKKEKKLQKQASEKVVISAPVAAEVIPVVATTTTSPSGNEGVVPLAKEPEQAHLEAKVAALEGPPPQVVGFAQQ